MIRGPDSVHFRGPEGPAGEKTVPGKPELPAVVSADSRRASSLSTRPITSLIDSLKLPPGRLSASILSFAKFFSLPLDASFLGHIRQKALGGSAGADSPHLPGEGRIPAPQIREARALAALASASKGVELSPEALSGYARALLRGNPPEESLTESLKETAGTPPGETEHPDRLEGRDSGVWGDTGGEERGSRDGDPAFQNTGGQDTGGEGDPRDSGKTGGKVPGRVPGNPVRERALAAQGPLLSALNRLPGRDGRRWIVLPFSLEGLDLCLRILLVPPGQDGQAGPGAYRAEQMGLDIDDGEGAWRFIFHPGDLNDPNDPNDPGGGASPLSLEFSRSPAPGKGRIRAIERELAEFMGLPIGSVRGKDLPSFAESRDWTLLSVNKEV